jgi:DNA-binding response OmpR family regulator
MSKPRILIVDDDPDLVRLLALVLEPVGYDVQIAYDARQGLAEVMTIPPNLILLDYWLPGKDGLELLRDIRSISEFDRVKIILITSQGMSMIVDAAIKYDVADFLLKPFELDFMLKRVMKVLPVSES